MSVRPRSRRNPVEYVPPLEVVEEIRTLRRAGQYPEAVLVGRREWALMRAQPEALPHLFAWPGDPDHLDGVPVLTALRWARPRVIATREEYEAAMLDGAR